MEKFIQTKISKKWVNISSIENNMKVYRTDAKYLREIEKSLKNEKK